MCFRRFPCASARDRLKQWRGGNSVAASEDHRCRGGKWRSGKSHVIARVGRVYLARSRWTWKVTDTPDLKQLITPRNTPQNGTLKIHHVLYLYIFIFVAHFKVPLTRFEKNAQREYCGIFCCKCTDCSWNADAFGVFILILPRIISTTDIFA